LKSATANTHLFEHKENVKRRENESMDLAEVACNFVM